MIPVSAEIEMRLNSIAERTGRNVTEIIQSAVEAYEARMFLAEMNDVYDVLQADFKEWGEYMSTLSAWISGVGGDPAAEAETGAVAPIMVTDEELAEDVMVQAVAGHVQAPAGQFAAAQAPAGQFTAGQVSADFVQAPAD